MMSRRPLVITPSPSRAGVMIRNAPLAKRWIEVAAREGPVS